jgi:hypothetical protein
VKLLSMMVLLVLCGCAHSVVFINCGFGNKTAAAFAAPLTPEAYCIALLDSKVKLRPVLTQEQQNFCKQVEAGKSEQKESK